MDLRVSYNWLREYLPGLKATPEEVAEKLSLHSFSVERWKRMDEGLDPAVVVGRIEKIEAHPNADKLRVVRCQVSGVRDQEVKIVCGGSNLCEGQLVAVALPGAKVRWHGQGELVELKPTEIRGVKSEGMICTADEIGLFEMFPHKEREILDLTAMGVEVGVSVTKALGLDDTIFEIEITTNRPDAMGMIGLAREVGAIFGIGLKIKDLRLKSGRNPSRPPLTLRGGDRLDVKVEVPKLCPRYIAVAMDEIKVGPSPWWIQRKLIASGVRPINNMVDITNYVLLEYGQPTHVFDHTKLTPDTRNLKPTIVVRLAKKGEKILALDGKAYDLDEKILVIADAEKPVAIAGIMGGEETGVHAETNRIVFEIANFDALTVRKGEHQLALSSDSSTRFNKGLPVQLPEFAAGRLVELAGEIAGGYVVQVVDAHPREILRSAQNDKNVKVSPKEIAERIGVSIAPAQMKKYLTALGFKVAGGAGTWTITFPYWREVEAGGLADIVEEVARMHGYHTLPSVLPPGVLPDEAPNIQFVHEHAIKEVLRGAGCTEVYTYSFVSADDIRRASLDPAHDALMLSNPLTSELTHMRPWLGISMLKTVAQNEKERARMQLFELSNEYHPRGAELPDERQKLIVACAGTEQYEGDFFFAVKGIAEHLSAALHLPALSFEKVAGAGNGPWVTHYHPSRVLLCKTGRDILGVVGELHPSLIRAYGIANRVAFLEWEVKVLLPHIGSGRAYRAPLAYPPVKRDIAFVVNKEVEYATLHATISKVDSLVYSVELFDQYEGKGVPAGHRSIAFHISYVSSERTLTAQEADRVHEKLVKMLETKFNAKIRD